MKHLYVVGGRQNPKGQLTSRLFTFQHGIVAKVNPETGHAEVCAEHVSPPDVVPDDEPSVLFKASTVEGDELFACTETELLIFHLPTFERVGYISLPCFNDIHHVCPTADGHLLVANTGLEMVLELTRAGEVLREWDVLNERLWSRFSRSVDYRKVASTKPHRAHPNFVFQVGNDVWAVRGEIGDAVCLTTPRNPLVLSPIGVHDGLAANGRHYFTSVDGHVIIVDSETWRVVERHNLNQFDRDLRPVGWCRGLAVVDDRHVLVGFTRFRRTKFSGNLRWLRRGYSLVRNLSKRPTRIALYDLKARKICWEHTLEQLGMRAVFSIHVYDPKATKNDVQKQPAAELASPFERADHTMGGDTMTLNLLPDWTENDFQSLEKGILLAKHRLMEETDLFTSEALARLLDSHPEDCLHVNTMGHDTNRFEWREGDRNGVPGDVLLETVKNGHLWINVRNMCDHQPAYAAVINQLLDELEARNPSFVARRRSANLLISSPDALVHYHVDIPVNMLWHLRGTKRVWVYPHFDHRFVSQSVMEKVCAGEFSEDVPYDPAFDKYALVFDVQPGQLLTWPQHTPHRVTNLDGLNISLSTEHHNSTSVRRNNVHLANQYLRRRFGLACVSTNVNGPMSQLKQTVARTVRFMQRWKKGSQERFTYPISFVVDPEVPNGYRLLDVPLIAPHEEEELVSQS